MLQSAIVVFDIDGVVRDVGGSYRRALADTVEHLTGGAWRPSPVEIDALKAEGVWNNDWEASQELVYRYFERVDGPPVLPLGEGIVRLAAAGRGGITIDYERLVAFFQSRYRGTDPVNWNGYICQEPLLLEPSYLELLAAHDIAWGFFSGATRGSAEYILERRLGLQAPVLVAMEDAPGKPDPTGLFLTIAQLEAEGAAFCPVFYVGDTVADMYTIQRAREQQTERVWRAIGVLPPHAQTSDATSQVYAQQLSEAGADAVFWNVQELTPERIGLLLAEAGLEAEA